MVSWDIGLHVSCTGVHGKCAVVDVKDFDGFEHV